MRKYFLILIAVIASFSMVSFADARPRHSHHKQPLKIHSDLINTNVAQLSGKRKVRYARRGGACDGVHRCICGTTQASYYGLPRVYQGHNLALAKTWRDFEEVSAQPGAVVVQDRGGIHGHVSRIVKVTGSCTAIVADEKGQYERNICSRGATYHMPPTRVASLR